MGHDRSSDPIPCLFIFYHLYPVDITHYINSNYCTEYFYATHNVKNVIWRPVLIVTSQATTILRTHVVCLQN
jgi:hypothetical protein